MDFYKEMYYYLKKKEFYGIAYQMFYNYILIRTK